MVFLQQKILTKVLRVSLAKAQTNEYTLLCYFFSTAQSRCLLDHGSSAGQLDHSAEGALPGERFDANQQCKYHDIK